MFDMDSLSEEFLSVRLGEMLEQKAKLSKPYRLYKQKEQLQFDTLMKSLSPSQKADFDEYWDAVIGREIQELYFAYIYGLRDGIRVNDLLCNGEFQKEMDAVRAKMKKSRTEAEKKESAKRRRDAVKNEMYQRD
ncbi:MAG: hypothetical protein E7393_03740 [Ruminococcaceae bacterium]|nr:hypothetical protein [Oscillospiraceae bacterium]